MNRNNNRIIGDIEILRGLAVLMVLYAHLGFLIYWQPAWLKKSFDLFGFFGGVDLFFCISGFVISRSFLPQISNVWTDRKAAVSVTVAFWIRRCWRLLPSAWLWAILCLLCTFFGNPYIWGDKNNIVYDFVAAITHCYNFHSFAGLHGQARTVHSTLGVYWSLSLEEQFYILFPLILIILKNKARWVFLVLFILSFFIVFMPFIKGVPDFFRWGAFTFGVLIGWACWKKHYLYTALEPRFLGSSSHSSWLIVLFVFVFITLCSGHVAAKHTYSLLALASGFIVFVASFNKDYLNTNYFLSEILCWLGSRSYSLYLIHMPSFLLTRNILYAIYGAEVDTTKATFDPTLWQYVHLGIGFAFTFIFAELNYRFLELPLRDKGKMIAQRYLETMESPPQKLDNQ
jgi:peptidoglycan/LPS O-acetylase OafA/YrhL